MNNNITKRFIAYLLDILFVYLLISLIISIRFINPTYDKFSEAYEKYAEVLEKAYNEEITINEANELNKDNIYNISKYNISSNIVIIIVLIGYYGFFQKYNNGQTLGKKITKLKVTGINEEEVSIGRYILRILPIYYVSIGNIIATFINTILIFILNQEWYTIISSIIIYLSILINIVSIILIFVRQDKRSLHDLISKTKVIEA